MNRTSKISLCQNVNPSMLAAEKVAQLIKSAEEEFYQTLLTEKKFLLIIVKMSGLRARNENIKLTL